MNLFIISLSTALSGDNEFNFYIPVLFTEVPKIATPWAIFYASLTDTEFVTADAVWKVLSKYNEKSITYQFTKESAGYATNISSFGSGTVNDDYIDDSKCNLTNTKIDTIASNSTYPGKSELITIHTKVEETASNCAQFHDDNTTVFVTNRDSQKLYSGHFTLMS